MYAVVLKRPQPLSQRMSAPEGNSQFCFPESLKNIAEIQGETKLFPEGTYIKCFVYSNERKINNIHTIIVSHDKNSSLILKEPT
jgi:hypothetical protein